MVFLLPKAKSTATATSRWIIRVFRGAIDLYGLYELWVLLAGGSIVSATISGGLTYWASLSTLPPPILVSMALVLFGVGTFGTLTAANWRRVSKIRSAAAATEHNPSQNVIRPSGLDLRAWNLDEFTLLQASFLLADLIVQNHSIHLIAVPER